MTEPTWEEIETCLNEAACAFKRKEEELLRRDTSERSMVFRFALHLCAALSNRSWGKDYTVDCEFNRGFPGLKRKNAERREANSKRLSSNRKPCLIIPDLIIHQRGEDGINLVLIEFKKKTARTSDMERDIVKVKETAQEYSYHYALTGIFDNTKQVDTKKAVELKLRWPEDEGN